MAGGGQRFGSALGSIVDESMSTCMRSCIQVDLALCRRVREYTCIGLPTCMRARMSCADKSTYTHVRVHLFPYLPDVHLCDVMKWGMVMHLEAVHVYSTLCDAPCCTVEYGNYCDVCACTAYVYVCVRLCECVHACMHVCRHVRANECMGAWLFVCFCLVMRLPTSFSFSRD